MTAGLERAVQQNGAGHVFTGMSSPVQASRASSQPTAPTLFRPGQNCSSVVRSDRIGLVVDGDEYFTAFAEAAELAQESILILAWDFDSRTVLGFGPDGHDTVTLGDLLNRLVRRRPGLHVNILIWDYPVVYGFDREFPPIYGLGWKVERRIHLHYDDVIPLGACHHQKVVVIDDRIAFAGGLDLTSRRWDTCEHRSEDPRRTAAGKAYPPFHDTMMAVSGDAARALGELARERWRCATGKVLPVPTGQPRPRRFWSRLPWRRGAAASVDRWPPSVDVAGERWDVAISRTVPSTSETTPVREIEELYFDMIRMARRSIYIENQYFTAHRLGDALVERLAEPDGPEIVVVIRLLSHGWLEGLSMETLRTKLICRLRDADRFGRLRVYYPHVEGLPEGQCLDVHSKLMIVDDEVLRIGSANFANRSMGIDTECDLTIEARGDSRRRGVIVGFRARLLAEHLGVSTNEVAAATEGDRLIGPIESLAGRGDGKTLRELEVTEDTSEKLGGIVKLADPEAVVPIDGLINEFRPPTTLIEPSGPAWLPLLGLVAVLAGLTALWRLTPLAGMTDAESVARLADAAGRELWMIPAVLAAYSAATFLMFPRPLLTLFAVMAFGPWTGFGLAMAGILIATYATWLVGRRLRRSTVRRLAGRNVNRITEVLRRRGVLAMTALRLVPMAPFAVIGIVAGAVRLRLRDLILGTALGTLPGTLVTTVLGERLEALLRNPRPIDYWLFAGVVVVAIGAAILMRRALLRLQLPTKTP